MTEAQFLSNLRLPHVTRADYAAQYNDQSDRTEICACAGCSETLFTDERPALVDNFVIDSNGQLDFIELAHATCKPEWKRTR